jgi:hypothetical protein
VIILWFANALAIDIDATEVMLEHMSGMPVHVRGE